MTIFRERHFTRAMPQDVARSSTWPIAVMLNFVFSKGQASVYVWHKMSNQPGKWSYSNMQVVGKSIPSGGRNGRDHFPLGFNAGECCTSKYMVNHEPSTAWLSG